MDKLAKYWPWLALGLVIALTIAIRANMLQVPLERDEGEFAYMGQLMLQGIPPYQLAYNMKFPGIYVIYALIMGVFGQTIAGIHIGLLVFNCISDVLIFLLTRYLYDDLAGITAALVYAFLSVSPSVLGASAHATHFIVPLALGGIILLLKAIDQGKNWMLVTSGLLLGMAFLVKQHAIFFSIFAILFYFQRRIRSGKSKKEAAFGTGLLILSSAVPFLVCCAALYAAGVFPKFWFWTFSYARMYVSELPVSTALDGFLTFAPPVIGGWNMIWAIAVFGLPAIYWDRKMRAHWDFWAGFALFSFLTICPGFFFRPHYFITLLPAVSMLSGVMFSSSLKFLSHRFSPRWRIVPIFIMVLAVCVPMLQNLDFFRATPENASRMMYGPGNPFPEMLKIAEYIKNHSSEQDKIAVIGSEPQIYFYSQRESATGYIYVYSLMEPHAYALKMQQEMIREIESARPRYIVFVNLRLSWLLREHSNMHIVRWTERYLKDYYQPRGFMDSISQRVMENEEGSDKIGSIWRHQLTVLERKQVSGSRS